MQGRKEDLIERLRASMAPGAGDAGAAAGHRAIGSVGHASQKPMAHCNLGGRPGPSSGAMVETNQNKRMTYRV